MTLKFLGDMDLHNKRVLARFDFNVPLKDGKITDTTRADAALESIRYILSNGATKLTLMSHLGRPKGEPDPKYSLEPVATYLAERLGSDVVLTQSCLDQGIKTLLSLPENKIILMENLRFHKEEKANDRDFARALSNYGDIYINDAFGTCHRKHASTYGINAFFKDRAAGGLLLKKEIEALTKVTHKPQSPFVAVVGGAKVGDKIQIIESLLASVDSLLIGGAMSYPFLKAKGHTIGKSLCQESDIRLARSILSKAYAKKIELPMDHVVADGPDGTARTTSSTDIDEAMMGMDIGPRTVEHYAAILGESKTVLWNGPMGLFERDPFGKGTFRIAEILAALDAFTLVGGGDSVSAVNRSKLSDKMGHVSTGGGASLEFIEHGTLPGIEALKFGID